jgi:hypothetical protein
VRGMCAIIIFCQDGPTNLVCNYVYVIVFKAVFSCSCAGAVDDAHKRLSVCDFVCVSRSLLCSILCVSQNGSLGDQCVILCVVISV